MNDTILQLVKLMTPRDKLNLINRRLQLLNSDPACNHKMFDPLRDRLIKMAERQELLCKQQSIDEHDEFINELNTLNFEILGSFAGLDKVEQVADCQLPKISILSELKVPIEGEDKCQ